MSLNASFTEAYALLNERQRLAVDTIEGPVLVIAGPGTGKTQILTLRIGKILLETDTPPEAILALTFTESGARAMRARLFSLIGARAYRVHIHTFHGLCSSLVARFPEHFPHLAHGTVLSKVDRAKIVAKALDSLPEEYQFVRPVKKPYTNLFSFSKAISDAKREGKSPEKIREEALSGEQEVLSRADLYHEKGAHKGKMKGVFQDELKSFKKQMVLACLYETYELALLEEGLYDFDDLLIYVGTELRRNEGFRLRVGEESQYILVDEHQDTNGIQNSIVDALCAYSPRPNLFVVGDDKQAIYRFQGASVDNFTSIEDRYSDVLRIVLDKNYRSHDEILKISARLMEGHVFDPASLALSAHKGTGGSVHYNAYLHAQEESRAVADLIAQEISKGKSPGQIAILYRNNNDARVVADALSEQNIAHTIHSDIDTTSHRYLDMIMTAVLAVLYPDREEILARLITQVASGIDAIDAAKVIAGARAHKISLIDILRRPEKAGVPFERPEDLKSLFRKIQLLREESRTLPIPRLFGLILSELSIVSVMLASADGGNGLSLLDSIIADLEVLYAKNKSAGLAEIVEYLDAVLTHEIKLSSLSDDSERKVRLMTAHRSKGLEFESVFVVGLNDGSFGGRIDRGYVRLPWVASGEDEDERRLLYVAMTRAKDRLHLSRPLTRSDGRELFESRLMEPLNIVPATSSVDASSRVSLAARPKSSPVLTSRDYIIDRFFEQKISVTALNNYINCPWNYFFKNLLRLPETKAPVAVYGTAMHAGLFQYFDSLMKGTPISIEDAIERFNGEIDRSPLSDDEARRYRTRGGEYLRGYLSFVGSQNPPIFACEYRTEVPYENVILSGSVDKIEGEKSSLHVIDYKTRSPVSRNDILGNTKNGHPEYFRQLAFYRFLLERFDPSLRVASGAIHFVEPNDAGNYVAESFALSDEAVANVVGELGAMIADVSTLGFWNRSCAKSDCEFCAFRSISVYR